MDTRDHPGGPSADWSGVAASSAPINWSQAGGLELRTAPCFEGLRSLDSGFTYVQERVRVFAKKTRLLICLSRNMSPPFLLPPSPSPFSFAAVCPEKMHQGPDRADIVDSCASSNKTRRIGTELALRIGARRACQDSGDRGAASRFPALSARRDGLDR